MIYGNVFKVGEELVYLALVTCEKKSREIKRRIEATNRAYRLRNQQRSRNLQTQAKLVLYKTDYNLILTVPLLRWTSKQVDRKALERKVLRYIEY